jgi:hypothetical protein
LIDERGEGCVFQGRYDESFEYYDRSLRTMGRALGDNHPDVATCLNNMGTVLLSQVCSNLIGENWIVNSSVL